MPRKPATPLSLLIYSKGLTRRDIAESMNLRYDRVVKLCNGSVVLPAAFVKPLSVALGVSAETVLECIVTDLPKLAERSEMRRRMVFTKKPGPKGPRKNKRTAA